MNEINCFKTCLKKIYVNNKYKLHDIIRPSTICKYKLLTYKLTIKTAGIIVADAIIKGNISFICERKLKPIYLFV